MTSACFYTQPINHRPEAVIDVSGGATPGAVHVSDTLTLSASGSSDADGDLLDFLWTLERCSGAGPETCVAWMTSADPQLEITLADKQRVHVALRVRDRYGAEHVSTRDLVPANREPTVTLDLVDGEVNGTGCYTVGRRLLFQATASDPDGDAVTPAFALTVPPASNPNVLEKGDGATPGTYFVRPDVVGGSWSLAASVDDGFGGSDVDAVGFCTDADQAPCVGSSDPGVLPDGAVIVLAADDAPRSFVVETVLDDLDPYPFPAGALDPDLGVAGFVWSIGPVGTPPQVIPGATQHLVSVDPSVWSPGDRFVVRVDVSDRVARPACAAAEPTCVEPPASCSRRRSWTVEVR